MKRPVEERRRLLKVLVAGGAAVTAYTLPSTWKKPIIDSIVIPVHAQSSVPTFIQTVEFGYTVTGPEAISGTLTPSNSPETHLFNSSSLDEHSFQLTPNILVDSSLTDTFNLTVNEIVAGGNSTNFDPSTQNLAPDNTTGIIPFAAITGSVDDAAFFTYQLTLTPDNPMLPVFFLEITFDEAPAGPGAPLATGGESA